MSRFQDRLDELADRLDDAVETYRSRSRKLLRLLDIVKDDYNAFVFDVEAWAIKEGLVPDEDWTDERGDPFLPVAGCEVLRAEVPDMGTLLRERVASLKKEDDDG